MHRQTGAAVMLLVTLALWAGGAACPQGPNGVMDTAADPAPEGLLPGAATARIQELTEDIRLLELLNRMQLSPEQIAKLLPLVDALQGERARLAQREAALIAELETTLSRKRQLVLEDKPVSADLQNKLRDLQTRRLEAQSQARVRLAQQGAGLRAILTEPQLAIATGADEARLQALELLQWLRELPGNEYQEEASATAEGLADPELGLDADQLLQLFNTARQMGPEQYETAQHELAQRLATIYGLSPEQASAQLAALFGHPRMARLLQEKLVVSGTGAG